MSRRTSTSTSLLWPTLFAVAGVFVLLALGTWQMQRKAWKDGLIAQIAARIDGPAIPLAEAVRRISNGEDLEYARVAAKGRFLAGREAYYWAPAASGPGWHVYAPLETAEGVLLLVNRGFVPEANRDPANRPEAADIDRDLIGLLRKPETKGAFAATTDTARRLWYWRDFDGMAKALVEADRAKAVPFFLDAEAAPASASVASAPRSPVGGVTRLEISNRHLEYALTWYGLAVTLIGVYAALVWSRRRLSAATEPKETAT